MNAEQLVIPGLNINTSTANSKKSPRTKPTIIETYCNTKRAATLLQISTTTLIRAKQQGKLPYKHGGWMVNFVGKKGKKRLFWTVSFNR